MSQQSIDSPQDFAAKIDHLLENVVVSISRDIEANYFAEMKEDQIVKEIYGKYAGLFVPSGCIETPKRKYSELFASHDALKDEEQKESRSKLREHRRTFVFRVLTGIAIAFIAILAAYTAKYLGIEIPIKGI